MKNQSIPEHTNSKRNYIKCPKCENGVMDTRVKRSPLVKNLLFFLDLKRYECSRCGHKRYVLKKDSKSLPTNPSED